MQYPEATKIKDLITDAQHIVVVQADNPDADSIGSALALEHILGDMGKTVSLYCGVDVPNYLRYLPGWDRVQKELPPKFDLSVIVDASTLTLLEKAQETNQLPWLQSKPCIVLDHHLVQNPIEFATATINDPAQASTGQLIYQLAKQLNIAMTVEAQTFIMASILGDTQGLSNVETSVDSYRVMADMIEAGVDRQRLEAARREAGKMPLSIFRYKAMLITRTEVHGAGKIASITIPQADINTYSPLYNPNVLIQNDLLQIESVALALMFKHYADGKITASIRCNPGYNVAAAIAQQFGGGGHPGAAGFKITDGKPFNEVKSECITLATSLLNQS